MLWEDSVPAFVISLTPHIESVDSVYQKIFQVNLTRDCFDVLKTTPEERAAGNQVTSLTLWAQQFAESGKIHPDDVPRFLNFIRLEHLKEALANHQKSLVCSYRRRSPNGFRWNTLEVLPDSTYTDEEQTVFLYVKDVHDVLKDSLEREETNVHMQEVIRILGEQRFCVCIIDLHTGEVRFIQEDGGLIHDNLSDDFPLWDNIIHSHFVNQMHMSYQRISWKSLLWSSYAGTGIIIFKKRNCFVNGITGKIDTGMCPSPLISVRNPLQEIMRFWLFRM